jgi:hypothetical protein
MANYSLSAALTAQWIIIGLNFLGFFILAIFHCITRRYNPPLAGAPVGFCGNFLKKFFFMLRGVDLILFVLTFLSIIFSGIFCIGFPIFMAYIIGFINPFSWFSRGIFALVFYGVYALIGLLVPQFFYRKFLAKFRPKLESTTLFNYMFWSSHFLWVLFLAGTTALRYLKNFRKFP